MERFTLSMGDVELECFSHGTGIAIVLLPGGSLSVGYLADLADALAAAGFRAIRVNPRGAGSSTGPMDGITLHDYAADVAGVIENLGVAPAFVLGHAYGNRIARTVAADRPDLVRGVVLVAAGGKVNPGPEAQQALATLFTPTATESEVLGAMRWMVGSPDHAATVWEQFKGDRAPAAAGAQMAAAKATPVEDWWSPPRDVPYLVIQGLKDEAAPAAERASAQSGARRPRDAGRHPWCRTSPAPRSPRPCGRRHHLLRPMMATPRARPLLRGTP